jgi:hypothetical protein
MKPDFEASEFHASREIKTGASVAYGGICVLSARAGERNIFLKTRGPNEEVCPEWTNRLLLRSIPEHCLTDFVVQGISKSAHFYLSG